MSEYIGNQPTTSEYVIDPFQGDSSTVQFTLSRAPASANAILVVVDGSIQKPTYSYGVVGTSLTFTSAPSTPDPVYEDFYKQGVYPAFFNQQWGGANTGGLPDGSLGEVATGYIVSDGSAYGVANVAASTYRSQGFKVSQNTNVASVWFKVYKIGNPLNNLELYIYSDTSGSPNALITNGTAIAQSGKIHTDNDQGEWVEYLFTANPSLLADTQYHIVLKSSGAVDASNYWGLPRDTGGNYPHGYVNSGDATPTWTAITTQRLNFLIEPETTVLQDTGLFGEGKVSCFEGAPLNQSGGFVTSNGNFINYKRGSFSLAGTVFTKDKTFLDIGTGTDNNRIVLRTNVTTGYAQLDFYEDDETKHTITGTTDISTGNHTISFRYRAEGDGADYLTLYVDGVSEGTALASQTYLLDKSFKDYGHTTIGGGFGLAPIWTDDQDMSVLPSASGWTWTGTATEADAMSVSDGILYQNGAGYGSTQSGYYAKTTTLNNATGWVVETKLKVKNNSNIVDDSSCRIIIYDGTKYLDVFFHEYYVKENNSLRSFQHDFTQETIVKFVGKGSDFYVYVNGKLIIDGAGLLTTTTASNQIRFGDSEVTAGENSTVEWHYFKYYEGSQLPEFSDCEISELNYWTEDKSSLFPTIYNSGTIQSVKALAGIDRNYIRKHPFRMRLSGINDTPTTTSITPVPHTELQIFVLGKQFKAQLFAVARNSNVSGVTMLGLSINGQYSERKDFASFTSASTNHRSTGAVSRNKNNNNGLAVVTMMWKVLSGTGGLYQEARNLTIEAE
jgi:hypothetical protein